MPAEADKVQAFQVRTLPAQPADAAPVRKQPQVLDRTIVLSHRAR
jgi:hypothetical protein